MTLEEFGANLRHEREKRNISLEKAAEELKINTRILSALEAGDNSSLPSPYVRGFIRTYANYLGIGADEVQPILQAISGQVQAPPSKHPVEAAGETQATQRQVSGTLKAFWAICILMLLGFGGYWAWQEGYIPYLKHDSQREIESMDNLPGANPWSQAEHAESDTKAMPSLSSIPAQIEEGNTTQTSQQDSNFGADASLPEKSIDTTVSASRQAQTEESNSGPENKQDTESSIPSAPHKLIITAKEECWVHSRADKTDTRQFSLRKGDTFALTFAKELELKLGNAGGVNIRYDGQDLPPAGTSGQVKTILFPPKEDR